MDTSGEGIYGVKFLLYDEDRNPIGEFTSDDEGWVYITADDLPDGANTSGRFYLRELEAAEGYILDEEYKTVSCAPRPHGGNRVGQYGDHWTDPDLEEVC